MKQSLQLRLHQQLTLTPQLQQSIRLLQLSTQELSQEISQMLQENPMLERLDGEDHFDAPQSADGANTPENPERVRSHDEVYDEMAWGDRNVTPGSQGDDDDDERTFQQADLAQASLQQHLLDQTGLTPLTLRDRQLLMVLIQALDDDGYLTSSLDEIAAMLPEELEIDPLELSAALKLLQSLEPVGVGARDLGECLRIQLDALPDDTPYRAVAREIVTTQLSLLGEREYGKLKKAHNLTDAEFIQVRQLITSLNPRPGAAFSSAETRFVSPDVFVRKVRGLWVTSLNPEAMPKLRINEMYASILRNNRDGGAGLSAQLQEARWLIKNVHQRFETILKVSQAIVDRQRMFFEHGEIAMKPLTLKEIAETVDLHESTISRVTTQKYMMTPRGLFEFKHFFARALTTEDGGAASNTAIRALIKQLVEAEGRTKPLSDNTIAELLGRQGLVVARRTVAKYRELMNIPPANQRKSL